MGAVRRAVTLAPAEAMRPPAPGRYGPTLLERAGLGRLLTPAMRMVIRNMERRPLRALLTTRGHGRGDGDHHLGNVLARRARLHDRGPVRGGASRATPRSRWSSRGLAGRGTRSRGCPACMMTEGSRDVAGPAGRGSPLLPDRDPGHSADGRAAAPARRESQPDSRSRPKASLLTDRLAERLDVRVGDTLRRRDADREPQQAHDSRRRHRPRLIGSLRLHGSRRAEPR